MEKYFLTITILIFSNFIFSQELKQEFFSQDIENFWEAYDKITSTKDTLLQQKYLKELYLDKATDGLKSLIVVRNYTQKEFLDYINNSPKFWNSIRNNTLNISKRYLEIETEVRKLKSHYPELKPMPIYFSIGAFRTGGTIYENKVLIGSELSLADENTITDELPEWRKPFYQIYKNPIQDLALLCTHEYIHTHQNRPVDNLLSNCIYEGIAEFISCEVTGKKSTTPAIEFGKANESEVVKQFVEDLFTGENVYNWMWGENQNHLKVRDLGYYIGYEIAERYYNQSSDKKKAIKDLIELDYTNENEVEKIVDATELLPKSLEELYADYENIRPKVVSVTPFKKGKKIKPGIVQYSLTFSEEMDTNYRGFDDGPLGENHVYTFKNIIGWSNNNKTITLEIEVKPNYKYQTLITNSFRNKRGIRLKPYLIEFETKKK